MIRIEADVFYTRSDLADLLKPAGVDVDTFVGKLKPPKVFKQLYRGRDLLEAYENAVRPGEDRQVESPRSKTRRGNTPPLNEKKDLIGGVIDPKKIGLEG